MAAVVKPRRRPGKKGKKEATPVEAPTRRHVPQHEAPDWGEPIGEAPEARAVERREAPDAGYGAPYESDE